MKIHYFEEFRLRWYLGLSTVLFTLVTGAFAVLGFFQSMVIYPFSSEITGCGTGSVPLGTTCGYFLNNATVALIAWIGGLTFVGPFYILWTNGATIGQYIGEHLANGDVSGVVFLIPHGVFEIPAILISIATGFYLVDNLLDGSFLEVRRRRSGYGIIEALRQTVPYILIALALFVVAAWVEANVSPVVEGWV